jgi:hypothetical protein
MTMLRAGLAGIVLAAAVATTASAQPYYARAYPGYRYPYPAYRYPYPAYGYPGYPADHGPPANYPWVPPAWANPYAWYAPYSSGVGPKVDGNTHY